MLFGINKSPSLAYVSEHDRPSPPGPPGHGQRQPHGPDEDERAFKKARAFVVASSISGPLSLLVGGVLLSSVGLVLGLRSYRQLCQLSTNSSSFVAHAAMQLRRPSIVAACLNGVALVLNLIAAYMMFPIVLDMVQNGYYSGVFGSSSAGSNSAWG